MNVYTMGQARSAPIAKGDAQYFADSSESSKQVTTGGDDTVFQWQYEVEDYKGNMTVKSGSFATSIIALPINCENQSDDYQSCTMTGYLPGYLQAPSLRRPGLSACRVR